MNLFRERGEAKEAAQRTHPARPSVRSTILCFLVAGRRELELARALARPTIIKSVCFVSGKLVKLRTRSANRPVCR